MTFRIVLLAAIATSSIASAQMLQDQGPPQHRIVHKNTFALRYNPLGLLYDGRFSYRFRLYQAESKSLRDNFIGVGVAPTLSPAFIRVGPYVEFNPASIFGLWGTVQFVQYFGSFDLAQGFPGAQSDFSDTAIRAGRNVNNFPANGYEVTLGANFQVKVWNIIVRSQARLIYGNLNLRPGQTVYYDQFYDMAMPNQGWALTNDLDLLYQTLENRLIIGARYTATTQFYDPTRHYDPAYPGVAADNSMHRVGPFAGYTFKIEDGAAFNNPTVFILIQWWAKHRFRTGVDTSAALPLMGVGFQMTGDFCRSSDAAPLPCPSPRWRREREFRGSARSPEVPALRARGRRSRDSARGANSAAPLLLRRADHRRSENRYQRGALAAGACGPSSGRARPPRRRHRLTQLREVRLRGNSVRRLARAPPAGT